MIRWELLFGWLLSLGLNFGFLLWGISLFVDSDALYLRQSAGSNNAVSIMTVELIASQKGRFEDQKTRQLVAPTTEQVDSPAVINQERMLLSHAFESQQKSQQNLQSRANSVSNKARENHTRQEDSGKKASDNNDQMPAQNKTTSENSKFPAKAAAVDADSDSRKGHSIDQAASMARSGDQFAAEVAMKIQSQIQGCYPEASKRRGEEGVVYLRITRQGNQLSVQVVRSSGYSRLDRCAISAVEKSISKLTAERVPLQGISLKPIRFQLQNE